MRNAILTLVLCALVYGHGSTPPPAPAPEPEKPAWVPFVDPDGSIDPDALPTGPGFGGPTTPGPGPRQPGSDLPTTPGEVRRKPVRPGARTRRVTGGPTAWRMWWEYNREHLVSMRKMLRERGSVTGPPTGVRDPLGDRRGAVLTALRKIAATGDAATLRSAALIALGRMGEDEDALLFVKLLKDGSRPRDVHEGAAVGLGVLPPIRDAATKAAVRAYLKNPRNLPTRARGMVLLAAGLRARNDPSLVMHLLTRATTAKAQRYDPANLAYACGLSRDPMVVPELIEAVRMSKMGGLRLDALSRAHAIQALGLTADPNAARLLGKVLVSRKADMDARMSAALSLARVLRENDPPDDDVARSVSALTKTLHKGRNAILRGYCAIALGGARKPAAVADLMEAIDHGGAAELKPFCALALGLAARTKGPDHGRRIRNFLRSELDKTHALELGSALSIALGLAGATRAEETLLKRLRKTSLPAQARGAAAQGLGLLRSRSPITGNTLEKLARTEKRPELLQDIVLALGLMGRHSVALSLVRMLDRVKSSQLQGRILLALGHLDHGAAVAPLLDMLQDRRHATLAREFAAVALGMMGDRRDEDVMFSLDAHFNLYATTLATHEFVRLY